MKTLKTTIVIAILLLLTPSITNAQKSTLEFKNAVSAETVVKSYVNALQKGDVTTMNAQLSKDAMSYGLGGGLDSLNVKQHKEYYKESTSNYTHSITRDVYLPIKVTDNWNEGEWILAWGTNTITNKKSDKKTAVPYHIAFVVANNKITHMYYFYDMSNFLKSNGWTITPPKK